MRRSPILSQTTPVAALYVHKNGVYGSFKGVDLWDQKRDARRYNGPFPVIAHPPCGRWCRLAKLVESIYPHMKVGDDGGTFESALGAVRRWGGVLEHPAWSLAWGHYGLGVPPAKGWQLSIDGGWSCEVSQAAYGHRARKMTWLYYVGDAPPSPLDWSTPGAAMVVSGFTRSREKTTQRVIAPLPSLSRKQASATPVLFAEALIALARHSS